MIFGKKILPTPKMNVFVCICCHSFGIQRGTSPCDYGPSRILCFFDLQSRKSEVGMTAAQLEVLTPDWG